MDYFGNEQEVNITGLFYLNDSPYADGDLCGNNLQKPEWESVRVEHNRH